MKVRKNILAVSLMFMALTASAVPVKRGMWQTLVLADGQEVRAELHGDEVCHYWLTADGECFVKNSDGVYARADREVLVAAGNELRMKANDIRMARAARATSKAKNVYEGAKKGLIILVNFADTHFQEANDKALYNRIANEKNFTHEVGFVGSISDYFDDQSNGKFDLSFDIAGPIELANRSRYYARDNGKNLSLMIVEACEAADEEVNFADYDWDGDGEADQVFLIYAGKGQHDGGDEYTIWPQEGVLSGTFSAAGPITLDGVKIDHFACSSELQGNGNIDGIGTACHEFSHCLGLPDIYDTSMTPTNYGMFCWDLMDWGNYLGKSYVPSNYTALERYLCGWMELTELADDCQIENMKSLSEGGEAYAIYNDGERNEFFILENRHNVGWDAQIPNNGLLIYKVDYDENAWTSSQVNSSARQRCCVIAADNKYTKDDLLSGAKGDIYPYKTNNALTNDTKPAATTNNANTDGTKFLNKSVTDITKNEDGTISFKFFASNVSTGITDIESSCADTGIYTIGGVYMGRDASALKSGVYVINGQKVVK